MRRGHIGKSDRDELEIPEIVLREALANALVHRDYETGPLRDQPTRIEVFPDRVEITSFGSLPAVVPIESLNSESENPVSWRRNPVVARIFQSLSLVELNASGASRMRVEMERASLAFPRFVANVHDSIVRVVLLRPPRPSVAEVITTSRKTRQRGQLAALISSTVADMRDHRQKVIEACTALGVFPVAAESGDALDTVGVNDAARQADIFIGIYGRRYGAVLEDSGRSATELEFNVARDRGIPILLFFMSEEHPVTRDMLEQDEAAADKMGTFKAQLCQQHSIQTFSSPTELGDAVAKSLAQVLHHLESERAPESVDKSFRAQPPDLCAVPPYRGSHQFIGRAAELESLTTWAQSQSPCHRSA